MTSPGPKPKSTLRLLADAILDAVVRIDEQFEAAGLDFPSLSKPFDPTHPTTALLFNPAVVADTALIVCATEQLSATVRPPGFYIIETALGFHKSSCLQTVTVTNIPEILREAGPQGLHVKYIAEKNGMDADKIARVLRVLATSHIFTEIEPDVFSNNRLSSVLDTKKSTSDLFSKPRAEKYVEAAGIAALVEAATDEYFKSSAFMTENLTDPTTGHTDSPTDTAFNRAFNTTDNYWTWLNLPGDEYRNTRFTMAMKTAGNMGEMAHILHGFPWDTIPDGSKVVDVGGGIGSVSLSVAKHYPKLKFVVQDLAHVVNQAGPVWNGVLPGSVDSGRVVFQEHDFFTPQPIKDANIFLLRAIMHDWGTSYVKTILRHLRDAAVIGSTKLIMINHVISYACKPPSGAENDIEMPAPPPVPEFLLPNLGRASSFTFLLDMQMLVALHGQERTIAHHIQITSECGWKITHVYEHAGIPLRQIVAVPV